MAAQFILCLNRQGKVRLSKWYIDVDIIEQRKKINKIHKIIQQSQLKMQIDNYLQFDQCYKLVFKKYNGLYFIICILSTDNETLYLQSIPLFVQLLDSYFDTVSELDLIFNFYKMYRVLDQIYVNGEIISTNKDKILVNLKLIDL